MEDRDDRQGETAMTVELSRDVARRSGSRTRSVTRFQVAIWDERTMEIHSGLVETEHNYWVDFAWRHGLNYRVEESRERVRGTVR